MARYTVEHAYSSYRDGQRFGRWEPGIDVELDPDDADWVNRDSPGTLTPVQATTAEAAEPPTQGDADRPVSEPVETNPADAGDNGTQAGEAEVGQSESDPAADKPTTRTKRGPTADKQVRGGRSKASS